MTQGNPNANVSDEPSCGKLGGMRMDVTCEIGPGGRRVLKVGEWWVIYTRSSLVTSMVLGILHFCLLILIPEDFNYFLLLININFI